MVSAPLSKYPRATPPKEEEAMSATVRAAGCGCIFVPASGLLLTLAVAILLGKGVPLIAAVGTGSGRGTGLLVAFGAAGLCLWLGARWVGGEPRTRRARARVLLGVILLTAAIPFALTGIDRGAPVLAGFAVAVIVSAFVRRSGR